MTVEAIYILCAATSGLCFLLLFRGYLRSRARLLLWSSASFFAFTVSNALLVADLVFFPTLDLSLLRSTATLVGLLLLISGLILSS